MRSVVLAATLAWAAFPAGAATYTFDVLAGNTGVGAFNTFLTGGINSAGTTVLPYHTPGASGFDG